MEAIIAVASAVAALISASAASVSALVALAALLVAIYGARRGYSEWRRKLRGATEYQVALRVLKAIYRVRDGVFRTRMPGDPLNPRGRPLAQGESDHLFRTRNLESEYARRIEELVMDRQDLLVAEQEAASLWGTDAHRPLERLYSIVADLILWSERYFAAENLRDAYTPPPPVTEEMERIARLLYRRGSGEPIETDLESAVEVAAGWYRNHLH